MPNANDIPSSDEKLHNRDYIWIDINPESNEVTQNEVLEPSIQTFIDSLDTFKSLPLESSGPIFQRVVFRGRRKDVFHTHDGGFLPEDEEISDGSYKGKTESLSTDGLSGGSERSGRSEADSEVEEGEASKGKVTDGGKSKVPATKKLRKAVRAEDDAIRSSDADGEFSGRTEIGLAAACTVVFIAGVWILGS